MSAELVSIITRTKDRPELLTEAMASVALQDWPAIEHIVVNDGGASVAHICDRFRDRVAVRYLEPGAVGRCKAGNAGLAVARGRFIAWLDDDDLYFAGHIRRLAEALSVQGRKIAYSDAWRITQSLDPATGLYRETGRALATPFEGSKIALWRRGDLHLVTVLHDRECSDRLGGLDETLPVLEDLEMFGRFAQEYEFHHVPGPSSAFRVRDDNTNAVTAMRKEFAETRAILYRRYAHIVMPELLTMVEFGEGELGAIKARVAALEAEMKALRAERAP